MELQITSYYFNPECPSVFQTTPLVLKVPLNVLCIKVNVFLSAGSPPNSNEGLNRRLLVYQHCIPLCESGDLQTEVAADIIGLLMLEVNTAPLEFIPNRDGTSLVRV